MNKIGLIAGGGFLPIEFVRSVKKLGDKAVVYALHGMALKQLDEEADKIYWLDIGQHKKLAFLLLKERIRYLAMVGKVDKSVIYKTETREKEHKEELSLLDDKKDYSILERVTKLLGKIGIEVISGTKYLSHLIPEKGVLTKTSAEPHIAEDIQFGYKIAKKLADIDVGQTVIVKDKTIVAVEAMEGTDAVIERAEKIAGKGCVMVKVSRSNQDMRWDVPTVGINTIKKLSEYKYKALAIEKEKMYLVEKDQVIKLANEEEIVVEVI